jgi:putative transposase
MHEGMRLMEAGQGIAAAARDLMGAEPRAFNWIRAHRTGTLEEIIGKAGVTAEQMGTETLFESLKVDRLHGERFQAILQSKDEPLAWLLWYDKERMHSTPNWVSPLEFENDWKDALTKTIA